MTVSLQVSERRACQVIGISRSVFRYLPALCQKKDKIKARVIELACMYGRYGYRQITNLMKAEGYEVGKDQVFSIWQREGLKVPRK